ncbi:THAPSDRAFT_269403, partial [Thalassiosira pseudonana CCMP1335]
MVTESDLLVMHSHQFCEVSVKNFPGPQLHINAEYYDLHPEHYKNIDRQFTLNYLPEGDRSVVLGPHEDSQKSVRVPYCSMRLWYMHLTRNENALQKIIDPTQKPKNTKENFLLYINSHYIEYREDQQGANAELFSHYRYALVMENTEVEGYVSEKILDAFLSGTVPIYFGSRFVFNVFNPRAFIYF